MAISSAGRAKNKAYFSTVGGSSPSLSHRLDNNRNHSFSYFSLTFVYGFGCWCKWIARYCRKDKGSSPLQSVKNKQKGAKNKNEI